VEQSSLHSVCLILSAAALLLGGVGMALSYVFLTSSVVHDITAGAAGFIAAAVLSASGLIKEGRNIFNILTPRLPM
jgi:uncharacterized protein involved in response to NO